MVERERIYDNSGLSRSSVVWHLDAIWSRLSQLLIVKEGTRFEEVVHRFVFRCCLLSRDLRLLFVSSRYRVVALRQTKPMLPGFQVSLLLCAKSQWELLPRQRRRLSPRRAGWGLQPRSSGRIPRPRYQTRGTARTTKRHQARSTTGATT